MTQPGQEADTVTCRHCECVGTIRPAASGRGRPELRWSWTRCPSGEHEPTSESLAAASRAWWAREKARRRAEKGLPPKDDAPTGGPPTPERRPMTPAHVVGLVLVVLLALWLLAAAPLG